MKTSYDVVIAGGGVMGASTAFWLSRLAEKPLSILVIERDRSYAQSATALSAASIRLQFSNPVNVKISQFGIEFIRNISGYLGAAGEIADLGFDERGYLFLGGSEAQAEAMRASVAVQHQEGAETELLDPEEVARRWPWLALEGVRLASFGPRDEGWFDNMGLLWGFRRAARAAGVTFLDGEVAGFERAGDRITGVRLASGEVVAAGQVVNACGTRAAGLMRGIGEALAVEPRKRTVFVIDAPNAKSRGETAPLLIDHTGFYLRPEGRNWITATVPDGDGACEADDFEPNLNEFEDEVWPLLYARAPEFDAVKVMRAWAGHYDYNRLDQNAVVGRWPGIGNLFVLNGFSGHGLQQSPALGRGMAELLSTGDYQTLDLTPLGPERMFSGTPFLERAIV